MAMLNVREFGRCRSGDSLDCIDSSIVSAVRHSPEIPQLQTDTGPIPHVSEDEGMRDDENRAIAACPPASYKLWSRDATVRVHLTLLEARLKSSITHPRIDSGITTKVKADEQSSHGRGIKRY